MRTVHPESLYTARCKEARRWIPQKFPSRRRLISKRCAETSYVFFSLVSLFCSRAIDLFFSRPRNQRLRPHNNSGVQSSPNVEVGTGCLPDDGALIALGKLHSGGQTLSHNCLRGGRSSVSKIVVIRNLLRKQHGVPGPEHYHRLSTQILFPDDDRFSLLYG